MQIIFKELRLLTIRNQKVFHLFSETWATLQTTGNLTLYGADSELYVQASFCVFVLLWKWVYAFTNQFLKPELGNMYCAMLKFDVSAETVTKRETFLRRLDLKRIIKRKIKTHVSALARCKWDAFGHGCDLPLIFYALLTGIQRHLKALSTQLQKYYNKDNLITSKLRHLLQPDGNICN